MFNLDYNNLIAISTDMEGSFIDTELDLQGWP